MGKALGTVIFTFFFLFVLGFSCDSGTEMEITVRVVLLSTIYLIILFATWANDVIYFCRENSRKVIITTILKCFGTLLLAFPLLVSSAITNLWLSALIFVITVSLLALIWWKNLKDNFAELRKDNGVLRLVVVIALIFLLRICRSLLYGG